MPDLPSVCEIREWVVFGPGYWRGALYTPEDCARVPVNFRRLAGYIVPVVKLGHDRDQTLARLRQSSGWLNLGDFAAVTPKPGGRFAITLTNVPTEIGRLVNAGRIRSGSVELIPYCDDPRDQGKRIEGPILTGVALLGEEHPAVKGVVPPPRAVFADGTPVPPATDLAPWFEAMASAAQMAAGFSDDYDPTPRTYRTSDGREYPLHTVCFSEMAPMITAEFLQSLGLKPDQIDQILAQAGGGAPPAGAPPAPAGADAPPPPPGAKDDMAAPAPTAGMPIPASTPTPDKLAADDQTMMSAAAFSDFKSRLGAMEKKMSDAAKASEQACSAAYSDRVEQVLKANPKRVAPNLRSVYRQMGLDSLVKQTFADVTTADREKAFAAWQGFIESLPESDKFSAAVDDAEPKKNGRQYTPLQQKIIGSKSLAAQNPNLKQKLIDATKPSAN